MSFEDSESEEYLANDPFHRQKVDAYLAYLRNFPAIDGDEERWFTTIDVAKPLLLLVGGDDNRATDLLFEHFNQRLKQPWEKYQLRRAVKRAHRLNLFFWSKELRLATAQPDNSPRFATLISSPDLLELDLKPRFLIDGILVDGQPCVIGGMSKTLKTSIAVDMAVSLSSGTPFLGQYRTQRQRVAIWSGESGASTLRDTAVRISAAKKIDLAHCSLNWSFELPKLGRPDHIAELERVINENGLETVFIDPLYLSLLDTQTAGQASNVYAMGSSLQPVGQLGQRTGCTIIVLHHFKRSASTETTEPASLEMLSQAGIVEWARQWVLLQRRAPYAANGQHELWMRCGGSAGHAGLWAVDVDEGVIDPETLGGRRWDVVVRSVGDAQAEARRAADQRKNEKAEERDNDDRRKVLEVARRLTEPETKRVIRELAGLSNDRTGKALTTLLGEGRIELASVTKYRRTEEGYIATAS